MAEVETVSKSTWTPNRNVLKKSDIKLMYDALHGMNTSSEREAHMRRTIHFPPEYNTVFANLINSVNRSFDNDEGYKQFRDILNAFQESIGDSGEAVQFVIVKQSPKMSPNKSPKMSPIALTSSRPSCMMPLPVLPSSQNLISNLSNLKIEMFVNTFLMCANPDEQNQFITRYVHATTQDGEPFHAFVNDIVIDLNDILHDNLNKSEAQIRKLLVEHLEYTHAMNLDINIHILYPFPQIHMARKGQLSLRNLGGGKNKRKVTRKLKKCRK